MPLKHQLTLPKTKEILLGLYSFYNFQKAIGNRTLAATMAEGIKALSLYVKILDYYTYYEDYDLGITELEIMELYEKFKQTYYSIKPIHYVE